MIRILLLSIFICGGLSAQVQDLSKITEQVQLDLKMANTKLANQRDKIAAEKIKLSQNLTQTQLEVEGKRRLHRLSEMSHIDRKLLLQQLDSSVNKSAQEVQVFNETLRNYGIQFSSQLLPGERNEAESFELVKDASPNLKLQQRFQLLEAGLDRLDAMIGGSVVKGNATDENAEILQGQVAVFGPLMWFKSDDGKKAGNLILSKSKRVSDLQKSDELAAQKLLAGEEVVMNLDITGGKATVIAAIDNGILTMIKKGGTWVYPILGLALIALICALMKLFQLQGMRNPDRTWLKGLLEKRAEDPEMAEAYIQKLRHPIADVLPSCLAAASSGAEVVEEILYEQLIDVRDRLKKWLPFIAITAATAPLLGLLGTVSGLIKTFNRIAIEGTGEAQTFAGGISEALITTMFGLVVAIPAFIIHALLLRKSKGIEQTTEKVGLGFVNALRKESKK